MTGKHRGWETLRDWEAGFQSRVSLSRYRAWETVSQSRYGPVIPINACTLCITAAAGTELAGAYSIGNVKAAKY